MKYKDDHDTGYILEVDLEYPRKIHDLHKGYPMAPELMTINEDMLSNVQKRYSQILLQHGSKRWEEEEGSVKCYGQEKVSALQFYPKQGLKLEKVHRVVFFAQTDVLRPFIEFNTAKSRLAKTDFERDLFKLMNNSACGKTMENVRNRLDFELVNTLIGFKSA